MKIALLPDEDRPREKLSRLGASALTDSELLALLLGTGTREMNVVELSQTTLSQLGGIKGLLEADRATLSDVKGLGMSKASAILALSELARRAYGERKSQDFSRCIEYLRRGEIAVEEAYVYSLDGKNRVRNTRLIAKGNEKGIVLSPAEILRAAIRVGANRFAFVHLHPSGYPFPSSFDLDVTKELYLAAEKVQVKLVDHVILAHEGKYSFRENGLFEFYGK